MRVCGCLKIFLKSQFLGYCVILSPMYSMVCRKDTDVKQTTCNSIVFAPCRGAEGKPTHLRGKLRGKIKHVP